MTTYAFELNAQAWRRDSYYVGSREPVKPITVVAETEAAALEEARRVLGTIDRSWYWRFWVVSAKDVRLVDPATVPASL